MADLVAILEARRADYARAEAEVDTSGDARGAEFCRAVAGRHRVARPASASRRDACRQTRAFSICAPLRLEYRMIGPRPDAAPTVVMLHEGLGSAAAWGAFPDQIAAATGAGVFVYSRAGYGRSSPGALPRSTVFHGGRGAAMCCRACSRRSASGAGFCSATATAPRSPTIYAGSVQDHRVRGLVLIAPHFFTEEIGLAEIRRARKSFESGGLRERLKRWHADVDCAFRSWNEPWLHPDMRQVGYHRSARLYPRADPDRAGRGRPVRHAQADRGGAAANASARSRLCCCPASAMCRSAKPRS